MSDREVQARPSGTAAGEEALGARRVLSLFVGFAALSLAILRPALHGPPVSDDLAYIVYNPYIFELSAANLRAILDPWGPAAALTVNYAPVHLLLHAVEVRVFGQNFFAWHVLNVLVHAANAVLLVLLLLRSRVGLRFAVLAGALFAVHPANVEAVAWLFQLKTGVAMALSLGALLCLPRWPLASPVLFGLALLTKASAAFALPMAAVLAWTRRSDGRTALALGVWVLLLALDAVPEFAAFAYSRGTEVAAFRDPAVHLMTIAALGARYLAMAATGYGVSVFHTPPPVDSPLDPWFLAALPAAAALTWRTAVCLRRRREEAAWWIGAAAAWFPVSQVFPFIYPLGDRYLYFMLPGLLGGAMLAVADGASRLRELARRRGWPLPGSEWLARVALAAGAVLALSFGLHAHARAPLWRGEMWLYRDAARHYPDGGHAYFLRALEALDLGDKRAAMAALRASVDRGHDRVRAFEKDPALDPLRDRPEFQALLREIAQRRIDTGRERGYASQTWLHGMAEAHRRLEEYDEAAELLDRALATEGPLDEARLRRELEEVRRLAGASDAR